MVKIQVRNLVKIFGEHPEKALPLLDKGLNKDEILHQTKQVVGLSDINFEVKEGEIFVVMGLSGSGKSTLIRCLNRLITPTRGKVLIDNQDVTAMNKTELMNLRRKKVGMVFQRFALFPHRTVLQNVAFALEIQGIPVKEREELARKSIEVVGLKGWENYYPNHLSGGMQQRVGLARALAIDPDILLMDEAFSALDPLIRRDMQDELLRLQNIMKKTIVFITHDLDEALKIGDRIALMKDGKIVQIGTPEEILINPADEYVEKFVEGVDLMKVLTAGSVMRPAFSVIAEKDGPRTALHQMKDYGTSSLYVVGHDRKLIGLVTAEDALNAANRGEKDITSLAIQDIPKVNESVPLTDILELSASSTYPIAVVDEQDKLVGTIVRGSILAALAGKGETNGFSPKTNS